MAIMSGVGQELRYTDPVTLHDYHPFRQLPEGGDWDTRKEEIRSQVQLAAGLLPYPEKTSLNAKSFGAVERDGFQVERVFFESFPGHFVTGSLFTPTGESEQYGLVDGKRPGVLCPHGHWTNGRFYDLEVKSGAGAVQNQLAIGAERFETTAHNPVIARCVQLARMGCVVLIYDMLGYADSVQFLDHRRGSREAMNSSESGQWGFVSPQATLRLQTNFGLQTWNSVRALDYLSGLENVDQNRLLVTGASGGATQTMVLAAIDERVDAAFPAVMLSTAMQGGCTCENSHYLRIDQGNVDIGAAFAPKPLGITAADDWTVELKTKGHPELLALYDRLKAKGNYEAHFNTHFNHNYNHVSRTQMYGFVNRHFKLGFEAPVLERDYEYLGREDLSVFGDGALVMESYLTGDEHERELNRLWAEDTEKKVAGALELGTAEPESWLRSGWETILRAAEVKDTTAVFELGDKQQVAGVVQMEGIIVRESDGDRFAALVHYPESWEGKVIIRLQERGVAAGIGEVGSDTVLVPHLFGQNDNSAGNTATSYSGTKEVPADSWQRSPVYFYGYNESVFVKRVHDVVTTVAMVQDHPKWNVKEIVIEAEGGLAAVALAARVILGSQIDSLKVSPGAFNFRALTDLSDDYMVPGALKYGGLEGLQMLGGE